MDAHVTRNGITLHVVDVYGAAQYGLDAALVEKFYAIGDGLYISTYFDGDEMVKFTLGDNVTYDVCPLGTPEYGKPGYIWLYTGNGIFGKAYNLADAFKTLVRTMAQR